MWRVYDPTTGLLFADDVVAQHRYDEDYNEWDSCELKAWLNGDSFKNNPNIFSDLERNMIKENTKEGDIWIIDFSDLYKPQYGLYYQADESSASTEWWIRNRNSRNLGNTSMSYVNPNGTCIGLGFLVSNVFGVRPELNVNMDNVIFTSAIGFNKSSFAAVGKDKADVNIWKYTIKDDSKTVSLTDGESITRINNTVYVPYTYTGKDVSQISIMITDKSCTDNDANILYYGPLKTTLSATGTGKGCFVLPRGLSDECKVYMLAEDVNEDTRTDYSSAPLELSVGSYPVPTIGPKNVNLGMGGFSDPANNASKWSGSKVYYGNTLWDVLDPTSGYLLADNVFSTQTNISEYSNWYRVLREIINGKPVYGKTYDGITSLFTSIESGAIKENATEGNIRILTKDEVQLESYGFDCDAARSSNDWWWINDPYEFRIYLSCVYADGSFHNRPDSDLYKEKGNIRPVFNLNSEYVLLTSASGIDQSSFVAVGNDKVGENIWKVTLKDDTKTVRVTDGKSVTRCDQTITVPYTYTGNDVSQITVMITDKEYTDDASILYYGPLSTTLAASGTGTFTLPSELPDGYKIYMMAEDVNEDTKTNYSSTPIEIVPSIAFKVTISNPANSHIIKASGMETQTDITEAMSPVVYTAEP